MKTPKKRQHLFKVTRNDCRWDYYRGSGKGGQARNKTENCVRCTHEASGAVGKCEDGRSKDLNKRTAFERMCNTETFQKWIKTEAMRMSGQMAIIEAKVDQDMLDTVVEIQDEKGKWHEAPHFKPTPQDIENIKEMTFDED